MRIPPDLLAAYVIPGWMWSAALSGLPCLLIAVMAILDDRGNYYLVEYAILQQLYFAFFC